MLFAYCRELARFSQQPLGEEMGLRLWPRPPPLEMKLNVEESSKLRMVSEERKNVDPSVLSRLAGAAVVITRVHFCVKDDN